VEEQNLYLCGGVACKHACIRLVTTVGVSIVQMRVGWSSKQNADRIVGFLEDARPGDVVITPEGSVSGYPATGNVGDLHRINAAAVEGALGVLEQVARERSLLLWVGVVRSEGSSWVNEAVGLSADGRRTYRKRNLADAERHLFEGGSELPTFQTGIVTMGVQICRELRFPEQWIALASSGAQLLAHLNHAGGTPAMFDVWRAMLVGRAHENQRWVASANAADPDQHCPSLIVAPTGEVILEMAPGFDAVGRVEVDLDAVRDTYLQQRVPVAARPRSTHLT
jgi:predicted amidohydrolase